MKFKYFFLALCILQMNGLFAQGTWVQKASLPGNARFTAVAFSIGTMGYLGTGQPLSADFWEYYSVTNTWTQKANFGGGPRGGAVGFSIGNKGYIGTGFDATLNQKDFWEYDPASNTWTQKANFGGVARWSAQGFSVAGKGYIGTGEQQDFWEYDPVSDTWTQKANFVLRSDIDRASFVIGNLAYWGTGCTDVNTCFNDWWEYNPASDTWTQKANLPAPSRYGAVGFSICNNGFLGLGSGGANIYYNDLWMYCPATNLWSAVTSFPGGARVDAQVFVVNNKAYVSTGYGNMTYYKDLWEYTYSGSLSVIASPTTICNIGQNATLVASGGCDYLWNTGETTSSIIVSPFSTTVYSVSSCGSSSASATVTVSSPPVATVSDQTICSGEIVTLTASGGGNYSWMPGGQTAASITTTSAGTYSVIVSAVGCADTALATVTVNQNPIANAGSNLTIFQSQTTTLSASGGANYLWSNGESSSVITVIPPTTTVYCVTVADLNSCSDEACVTVFVKSPCDTAGEFFFPNAFSPNGDGDNDVLKIYYGNMNCIEELRLIIYNRWGQKVFESTDRNFQWDGRCKGKTIDTGVLVYYLRVTFIDQTHLKKKGNITLVG